MKWRQCGITLSPISIQKKKDYFSYEKHIVKLEFILEFESRFLLGLVMMVDPECGVKPI
jgi:hypothetical protein